MNRNLLGFRKLQEETKLQEQTVKENVISVEPMEVNDVNQLNFGQAIEALKLGKRIARLGWNGKGMWLILITGHTMYVSSEEGVLLAPCIGMKKASGEMQLGWLASQADILSEDWVIIN